MATTRQALNSRFQRGSAVYTCRICKHQTRDTGGDGVSVRACDICYDLAGQENSISDTGTVYGKPENVAAQLKTLDQRSGAGTARRLFPTVCDAAGYEVAPKVALILNQSQARAVYDAMCALNNVGSVSSEFNLPNGTWVQLQATGLVNVAPEARFAKWEAYANQAAFAKAYGLN